MGPDDLSFRIVPDPDYEIDPDGGTVIIPPTVNIIRDPDTNVITVTIDPVPAEPIDVVIVVTDVDGNEMTRVVTIDPETDPDGDGTVMVEVGPDDLSFRIVPDPDYVIDPDGGDSVSLPTVSITDPVIEDDGIRITVTTDPIPSGAHRGGDRRDR